MDWELVTVDKLDPQLLADAFENRVAGIRVPGFLDARRARAAAAGITGHGLDYYTDVDPPIGKIGITQFEHSTGGAEARARYLARAEEANATRRRVFADSGDPVELVIEALAAGWGQPVGVATEPDGRSYFAGLVRVINQALLHCDWAPHDAPAPRWSIGAVNAQLAWNIYCQVPADGGGTVVHDRPWTADAEEHRLPDSYGYAERLVADRARVRFRPETGDLVFFNSRNFHLIESSAGVDRLSVSSFVGRHADGSLVLWS